MFQCLVKHGCVDLTNLIKPDKYSSCRVAEGAFGDVWKGEMQDGTAVAVKVLRFALVDDGEGKNLKRMVREIYAWSKLDHENVHKLLGMTIMEGRLGMVSRWIVKGNLRDYLERNKLLDRHDLRSAFKSREELNISTAREWYANHSILAPGFEIPDGSPDSWGHQSGEYPHHGRVNLLMSKHSALHGYYTDRRWNTSLDGLK
ncbi:unnamed protein product [Rhizoctonia solani]|uniref:Protein kinase domain-containing protein n=1 Tax=Rhizoctonia solani TaxID=456999 RepID=A0A8H2XED9_9AGAM|nr:unnamed protein product [Rhizoctonia solani]